jgi:hypothetical protein
VIHELVVKSAAGPGDDNRRPHEDARRQQACAAVNFVPIMTTTRIDFSARRMICGGGTGAGSVR